MSETAKKTVKKSRKRKQFFPENAYYNISDVTFFSLLLGPFFRFFWVMRTTKKLNFAQGFKRKSPLLNAILDLFIPGYEAFWAFNAYKRVSVIGGRKGTREDAKIEALHLIFNIIASVLWAIIILALEIFFVVSIVMKSSEIVIWDVRLSVWFWLAFLAVDALLTAPIVTLQWYINKVTRTDNKPKISEEEQKLYAEANEAIAKKREEQIAADFKKPFDPKALIEVRHLRKCFPVQKNLLGKVQRELVAVDDVSFTLNAGETLGIVGESGCGKTTMGRTVLKLHQPSGGQIIFNGEDITKYKNSQMRRLRTDMQIIFQDPYSSLPPRATVGDILSEPVKVHNVVPQNEVKDYVMDLMEKCGLRDYYYERYPHEFSGGQRQRICIARALSVKPKLVICDEPVSALDVSIQAQIINLLKDLQKSMNLTYLFISHDLSVVKFISDKVGVMYLGSMVEFGLKKDIFDNPLHPYTKALFSAIPNPNPDVKMNRIVLGGDIPSPINPPKGCRFHTRCPNATEKCKYITPEYKEYEPGHFAACHLLDKDE